MNPRNGNDYDPYREHIDAPDPTVDGDLMEGEPELAEADQARDILRRPGLQVWLLRVAAVIVVLGMLTLALSQVFNAMRTPSFDFLQESRRLAQDPAIQRLQEAVVQIRSSGTGFDRPPRDGTGFNISPTGVVVTNRHVVEGATAVAVQFRGRAPYYATTWLEDPDADLAVIYLGKESLPHVDLQLASVPLPGEGVLVIGNPLGFPNAAVQGRVLSYVRTLGPSGQPVVVMELEAPIHAGSSGSPVFDATGRVVAVAFARLPSGGGTPPRGLAVPVASLTTLLETSPPEGP